MIVVVTGGRDFRDAAKIYTRLDELHAQYPITELVHGDANGVDRLCGQWARDRSVSCRAMPARWDDFSTEPIVRRTRADGTPYNAAAGSVRNQAMLDTEPRPTYGIRFPGGKGTADMAARMAKARLIVWDLSMI